MKRQDKDILLPSSVEGYQPQHVPEKFPILAKGLSAQSLLNRYAVFSLITLFSTSGFLSLFVSYFSFATSLSLGAVVAVGFVVVIMVISKKVGDKALLEFGQGYTTLSKGLSVFWFRSIFFWRYNLVKDLRMQWDYCSLWQLSSKHEVIKEPEEENIVPGMYFSPHEAGRKELWTGVQWAERFLP